MKHEIQCIYNKLQTTKLQIYYNANTIQKKNYLKITYIRIQIQRHNVMYMHWAALIRDQHVSVLFHRNFVTFNTRILINAFSSG